MSDIFTMRDRPAFMPVSVIRAGRLVLHLSYGMVMAVIYPYFGRTLRRRILKAWSWQLLSILNIGLRIEGQQLALREEGCLLVANHISWLDIFVLNAIHPAQFIAKSEVRNWPLIGWLARRSGTIFIERALRRNASRINRDVSQLLEQGACISLFPEGTTTDGLQVGHFHSALLQPAIDARIKMCPVALRYENDDGCPSLAAVFTGDTTLVRSIWRILRARHLKALAVFTPELRTADQNRRILARVAQTAIAKELQQIDLASQARLQHATPEYVRDLLSSQSAYALLIDPLSNQFPK